MNTPDWDALFAAAARAPGDDEAWAAVYAASWPYLAEWVGSRYRLDPVRASDVLQDAFLQYHTKLQAGLIERPSIAHLRAFVRFCALTAIGDAARFVELDELAPIPEPADPEADITRRLLVDAALDRLPPRCAWLLRARYYLGQTSAEIAAATGLQPGHVDVLLHRCRAECRSVIEGLRRTSIPNLQRPTPKKS